MLFLPCDEPPTVQVLEPNTCQLLVVVEQIMTVQSSGLIPEFRGEALSALMDDS